MDRGCERSWEIDALREGRLGPKDADSFERHLRSCTACAAQKGRDERLRALGRAMRSDEPSELALRRLRTRVLRDAAIGAAPASGSRRARVAAGGLAAAACAVVAMLAAHGVVRPHATAAQTPSLTTAAAAAANATLAPRAGGPAPAPGASAGPLAGSVLALGDAVWTQQREGQVERVSLDRGSIAVHVRPQHVGERFLVEMPDGEIEVRGTTFEVSVSGGATRRVHVDEGTVDLRLHGSPEARLHAGDAWQAAPAQKAPGARTAAPTSEPPAAPGPVADDGSSAYADAMELLRRGRDDDAAAAFHEFVLAHPRAPQAEDASFLEAVALARAGRGDAAALAAEHHLARFPRSFHAKQAAVLVARDASERGECAKAREVLAPWLSTGGDAETRGALRGCGDSPPPAAPASVP